MKCRKSTSNIIWLVITDTYKHAEWLMMYMCKECPLQVLNVSKHQHTLIFNDGDEINEFIFVRDDLRNFKGIHGDIYIDINDFRRMWMFE